LSAVSQHVVCSSAEQQELAAASVASGTVIRPVRLGVIAREGIEAPLSMGSNNASLLLKAGAPVVPQHASLPSFG
jgi:hypothetical protein